MDLSLSKEELAFRDEVRSFVEAALPPALKAKADVDAHFEYDEVMQWHRILFEKGWVAPFWPVEHGGPQLDLARRFILSEELELSGAPTLMPFGLRMVGPVLMEYGSPAQRERFLPKILSGAQTWCQGYSEPGAGSDLAALSLRAQDDGQGHYVLNGQKTWTTYAQHADWIFLLARTDASAKKQQGISFFLVDMRTPGVTARPMQTLAGIRSFCDTFFDAVRVPKENLVGSLHGGWTVAKSLLKHERTTVAQIAQSMRALARVKRIAKATLSGGRPLWEDPITRSKISRLEIRLKVLQVSSSRALATVAAGRALSLEPSILKVRGTELLQEAHELALEVMGHDALAWFNEPGVVPPLEQWAASSFMYARAATIYAGSNEIQKNIISKVMLAEG